MYFNNLKEEFILLYQNIINKHKHTKQIIISSLILLFIISLFVIPSDCWKFIFGALFMLIGFVIIPLFFLLVLIVATFFGLNSIFDEEIEDSDYPTLGKSLMLLISLIAIVIEVILFINIMEEPWLMILYDFHLLSI